MRVLTDEERDAYTKEVERIEKLLAEVLDAEARIGYTKRFALRGAVKTGNAAGARAWARSILIGKRVRSLVEEARAVSFAGFGSDDEPKPEEIAETIRRTTETIN